MSYYASGIGTIEFEKRLSKEDIKRISGKIDGILEFDFYEISGEDKTFLDIWDEDKYHGDIVEEALGYISENAPITNGQIEYRGEDGALWRFIFENEKWKEENGIIKYGNADKRIEIALNNDTSLVAEINLDSDYKEIFVSVYKDGGWHQDLAFIRECYEYDDKLNVVPLHGKYEAGIYDDEYNEDYTKLFEIREYTER